MKTFKTSQSPALSRDLAPEILHAIDTVNRQSLYAARAEIDSLNVLIVCNLKGVAGCPNSCHSLCQDATAGVQS